MAVYSAVLTAKATGAISTIGVYGTSAAAILQKIFTSKAHRHVEFKPGRIALGVVADGKHLIDQVTVGCEGPGFFAIHCHGNPLIVEMIMGLLGRAGARAVSAEELLRMALAEAPTCRRNAIELEAKVAQLNAATLEGTKMLANQAGPGLYAAARAWLARLGKEDLDRVRAEAARILRNSEAARSVIYGCKMVLTGPPNSGKSTLLNRLAGREKAIVAEIAGTTRDWVSAECRIGPLAARVTDTAGLDGRTGEHLGGPADKAARDTAVQILAEADLVLLVLDGAQGAEQIDRELIDKLKGTRSVTVLNKSDLPLRLDTARLPEDLGDFVQISAKFGTGIADLKERIIEALGAADLDLARPVAFTRRQEQLLEELAAATGEDHARRLIQRLLNGPLTE